LRILASNNIFSSIIVTFPTTKGHTKNPCGEKNIKRLKSSKGHGIGLNVVMLKRSMEFKEQVLDTHVKTKHGKTIGEKCKSLRSKG
jgi:hypothetical protein